jgi:hypothetical protein
MKGILGFPIFWLWGTWWRLFQAFQSFDYEVPDEGYSRLSNLLTMRYLMKVILGFPILDYEVPDESYSRLSNLLTLRYLMKVILGFLIFWLWGTWWRLFQTFQSFDFEVPDESYSRRSNLLTEVPDESYSRLSNLLTLRYLMKVILGFPIFWLWGTWWRLF